MYFHYTECYLSTVDWSITIFLLDDGSQQPSLQSGAEGCQCRKAAAAALHACALHSHSCNFTQTAMHKGVEAASSAGSMHSQYLQVSESPISVQWLGLKKELTCVETAFFPFLLTLHPSLLSVGTDVSGKEALHTQACNCNEFTP